MSLQELSYLADVVGVVLIVASLLYVGRQIRQNTAMMRVSASNERVQRDTELATSISDNQEFAELWAQGGSGFHDLEEVRKIRLIFFERRAIVHWHNMFSLRSQGLLSDSDWAELTWIIRNLGGRRQSVREAWKMFRDSFDEPYKEFLDEQLTVAQGDSAAR